jgi:hypothetical protein
MDIDELMVHRAIAAKPELIEAKLGIKLDKTSLIHHYPLSSKGEHIDFVFNDVSGVTYLAEVKVRVSPIRVIPQLYDHEYKKFVEMNPEVDKNKIIPVIVTDEGSVTDQDRDILSRMSIRLCAYSFSEIEEILQELDDEELPVTIELPALGELEDFMKKTKVLHENLWDINFLLEGFRGETWWDGYYDFRTFWLWKENNYPETHKKIFKMLFKANREDCIWFTFLNAISDSHTVAEYVVFDKSWVWSEVLSAKKDDNKWSQLEDCLCDSGKWCILAFLEHKKRKKVIKDYLKKVGNSQESYFLKIMSKANNPFDAYNMVWKDIHDIRNIGDVVASEFATYLSQWRILPIIPSDLVRQSKYVKKALDSLEILKPMESHQNALLRIARKYSVAPIVIERAMHKLGRISGEELE